MPTFVACLSLLLAAPPHHLADGLRGLAAGWPRLDPVPAEALRLREGLDSAGKDATRWWQTVQTRADWEAGIAPRLQALERSLLFQSERPADLHVRVRKTLARPDHHVDCLTYETCPGFVVTANLYRPATTGRKSPGIVIVHSHHNGKTEGELQDMGVLWARAGCLVLILDLPGHGERRQHPYRSEDDYPAPYRAGRQDYYFRYNLALQADVIGDSLMGWMVRDILGGVDLLLSRPEIDAKKILVLGSVAGGGDPAAVAAALDRRIAAACIFNFGGPQPETRYPLPANVESTFSYTGSGGWESTRNLRRSAADGFLPWVIVGSLAPRRHIHAHEFSWDEEHDPVWKRLRRIHALCGSSNHLAGARGTGNLSGRPPLASHCNNIGAIHRREIHAAFKRWFGIEVQESDRSHRRPAADLLCFEAHERLPRLYEAAAGQADERVAVARKHGNLRDHWTRVLGTTEPVRLGTPISTPATSPGSDISARWLHWAERNSPRALVLRAKHPGKRPAVIAFGQGGPRLFLEQRATELSRLIDSGKVVILAQLGGLSELPPGPGRGRGTTANALASSGQMLGEIHLALRLREVRGLIQNVLSWEEIDPDQVSLLGDSFSPANAAEVRVDRPLDVAQPALAEPLGAHFALLAGLFEPRIASITARGGLISHRSLLADPFVHVPFDAIVPGALTTGEVVDLVAALAPRSVRLEAFVDGHNQRIGVARSKRELALAHEAYRRARAEEKLIVKP